MLPMPKPPWIILKLVSCYRTVMCTQPPRLELAVLSSAYA